ncbi:MAG: hypothetical protein PHQ59_04850 [Candidatus Daviesbacteria bacterium]|nr:hypothetical protein [Candidatus Daviesbacteria bacterium]
MDQILLNARTRIVTDQITHIKRTLPSAITKVNVKVGDEVAPNAILAEGKTSAGFRVVNLAKELGISGSDGIKFLSRPLGSNIFTGELLASKKGVLGLGEKILLSPDDGILDYYDEKNGTLRIKLFPKTIKLACGVWGIIDDVDETKGVITIRTMASFIYGMLGSGKEREGVLNVIGSKEVLIGSRQLEQTMKGQIIVGGEIVFADGLEKAAEYGIAGIISGGINAKNYKSLAGGWNIYNRHWADIGFSILITEGFGSAHMGDDIFSLLQKNHGNFSILDGNLNRLILPSASQNCMIYIRKTKIAKNPTEDLGPGLKVMKLQLNQRVRIIGPDSFGDQGMVEAIDKVSSKMPSGINSILVTVKTNKKSVRVCYQNLEILI